MSVQNWSPKTISVHEDDPQSVVFYEVQVRSAADGTTVLATKTGLAGDPSGDSQLPVGIAGGFLKQHPELLGQSVKIYVREQGPSGEFSDWRQVGDVDGHGSFTVCEIPNGAESAIVNL